MEKMSRSVDHITPSDLDLRKSKESAQKKEKQLAHFPNIESIAKNAKSLPPFEKAKIIIKKFGHIQSFGVNTHQGTVRSYNEDRVSILLNAQQR